MMRAPLKWPALGTLLIRRPVTLESKFAWTIILKDSEMAQNKSFSNQLIGSPFTLMVITPVRLGASEAWRRYLQELTTSRRHDLEAACQRWGIIREQVWLIETLKGTVTIILVVTNKPEIVVERLVAGELPFERQFREQLLIAQGVDLTNLSPPAPVELVLDWFGPTESQAEGGGG
jgi:hypothetical protein